MKWNRVVIDILSLLFVFVFFYSGLIKFIKFHSWIQWIQSAFLFKSISGSVLAIPVLEIGLAIIFLFRKYRRIAFYASAVSVLIFLSYIILLSVNVQDYLRFFPFDGVLKRITWTTEMYWSLLFLAVSLGGAIFTEDNLVSGGSANLITTK